MKYWTLILALSLSFQIPVFCADTGATASSLPSVSLVVSGQATCAIVHSSEPQSKLAATRLADYLGEHTGIKPAILSESEMAGETQKNLILIDGSSDHHLIAKLGLSMDVPGDRADAYHLRMMTKEKRNLIVVAGQSDAGAKFGVYRLMEELELDKGSAKVSALDITASPFIKTRSISLFNIWRVPVEVIRQCNLESWPAEKIQRNVDMYDAFGFNALETHDRFHEDFLQAVYGLSREQWRQKVYAMCDRAHADGMTVFLRQWGNSVALPVKELKGGYTPFGFSNLVPDIPEERQRWESEIRDYVATNYASHIDHFIGHWADAGGIHEGSHATIKDALILHNELRAAFRAINPKIETSFNLWNMANPKGIRSWPGYVDHRSVTAPGILEKDVIIAQATRSESHPYSQSVTDDILKDGYRAAVWTWRRGDTEVRLGDPGVRIRIHGVMGDYFHNLPEGARKIEWHNIERNQHGLANDVNYYVAAKLMWDPKTDVDAAVRKYCALVFGPENSPALTEAFFTLEASRDVEILVSKNIIKRPEEGAQRARAALVGLDKVTLAEGHRSRLPSVTSPQEMLAELRGSLAIIAENAEICAKDLPAMLAFKASGKKDEADAIAAKLKLKIDAWIGTIAGGMEGMWLMETLQAKIGLVEKEGELRLGFITYNAEKFVEKDSAFTLTGKGKTPAIALLKLPTPLQHQAQFHFQCHVAKTGKSQNAGFVFGPTASMTDLTKCEVRINGGFLRISGQNISHPVKIDLAGLDPAKPLDITVLINLDEHRVTFKAGNHAVEADLDHNLRELRHYGYIVEKTTSRFGPIEVKETE